jgi:hypothetical protein
MEYPWGIPSLEEVRARNRNMIYEPPWARLIEIGMIIGRHLEHPTDILSYVHDIEYNLNELPERIERMMEYRQNAQSPVVKEGMPNVHFHIDHTIKGNLRVSYVPEYPRDFGQWPYEYQHHGGYDPVNTLLFIKDYSSLRAAQTEASNDPQADLFYALMGELMGVVVKIVKEAEHQLRRHCNIISKWQFAEEPSGVFVLLTPEVVDQREQAAVAEALAKKEAEDRERIEKPMREHKQRVDRWASEYGIEPARIVALTQAFNPCRVPFDDRVKILTQHFNLRDSPILDSETVRRMARTLSLLGMPIPAAEITLDEARALAQRHLGRIRNRPSKAVRPKPEADQGHSQRRPPDI